VPLRTIELENNKKKMQQNTIMELAKIELLINKISREGESSRRKEAIFEHYFSSDW
jgi:hypothetical protein